MSFKYLFIPADQQQPVVQHEASKSGGLENDLLRRHAEKVFTSGAIDKDKQRAAVASQLGAKGIDPAKVDEMLNSQMGDRVAGSVEIISLAIPTNRNNFHSISLYCDGNSAFKESGKVPNVRATAIVRACGHVNTVVMGDCFIGRAKDDEREEWERLDFTLDELSMTANWVVAASVDNAGKNLSNYSTSGALDMMQNQMQQPSAATPAPAAAVVSEFSEGQSYVWTQTNEDVEVRMKLPAGLLSKQISVKITPSGLFIARKTGGPIEGVDPVFSSGAEGAKLSAPVNVEDSSWSIAEEREGRLLTVTLCKVKNATWKKLIV